MKPRRYLIPAMVLGLALFALPTRADVVVLKTGKRFDVEKVWREKGQVWIIFHGMRASIPASKIARIESRSNGDSAKPDHQKEKISPVKNMPRPTPRDISRRQPMKASQTALAPQSAKIEKDQTQIFPDGKFGDLRWGTTVLAIKGLEKIQDAEGQDGVVEYRREKEDLNFGRATLSSIHYAFWRDHLYMLTIRTQGHSNYTALRREVFRQFGKGLRADQALERYLWMEAPNDMMLQYSKADEQGLLWLRSVEIDRQYKLARVSGHASYLRWMKSRN
jgi:hypothetical protein